MVSAEEQRVVNDLQANWIWVKDWVDSSTENTAARVVKFTHQLSLSGKPSRAILRFSADTRYKLYVNGSHVAVGPARSSPLVWYYDELDVAPYLKLGVNELKFLVIRYFASSRGGMPFERTSTPGLTVVGSIETEEKTLHIKSTEGWLAQIDNKILFPTGLIDDVFLHINERITPQTERPSETPLMYNFKGLNGELLPWRLRRRAIPMPEQTHVGVSTIRACNSPLDLSTWNALLVDEQPLKLPAMSSHVLDLQADVHSTAFLQWAFKASKNSQIKLKAMYSEGYELEPRAYPFFRTKADRLDADNGHLIGPFDEVVLDISDKETTIYEPYWFRTFRLIRLEISVGSEPVDFVSLKATQVNYPLDVKASWSEPGDANSQRIWDVSIRTMRNCMFDGYSDCPFYEQLQYSGDSRSVGLFHYLLSGDDRLMRQAITNFAASITSEGLTQSRFPSHVPQIIAGFSLYWILQICDHHLYFGDTAYARSFLPRIDGVFEFYDSHVDELGLVSGFPEDVWQYVDWVTTWGATETHPDKGVPTSGRASNRHTFFSLLYAWVLKKAAKLVRDVGRPGYANEYEARASSLLDAVRKHCYDGKFFTDSTSDIAEELAYSQHCQVFAVLAGAAPQADAARLLKESFGNPSFSKCSYVMQFYALRAFALAEDEAYEAYWATVWDPWRRMLQHNLSTWEEDDVRQRSDCHAWGSVPVYEYCTELAGVQPISPGSKKILFKPRVHLSSAIDAKVALGKDIVASVSWTIGEKGEKIIQLNLSNPVSVVSQLPGQTETEHGVVEHLQLQVAGTMNV